MKWKDFFRDVLMVLVCLGVVICLEICIENHQAEAATTPSKIYTVVYHANGGINKNYTKKYTRNVSHNFKYSYSFNFYRKGYTLIGWSTTPKGKLKYHKYDAFKNLTKAGKTIHLYAKWKNNGKIVKRALVIYDTNSRSMDTFDPDVYDELVEIGYFKDSANRFVNTFGQSCSYIKRRCNNTYEYQIRNAIKSTFADSDNNDINYIYIATHGEEYAFQIGCRYDKKENSVEYLFLWSDTLRLWLDSYVNGKTLITTDACMAGTTANDFYECYGIRNTNKKNLAYAKKHYVFLTATGKSSTYTYIEDYWFDFYKNQGQSKKADLNSDGKISVYEMYKYIAPLQYKYNVGMYKQYNTDNEKATYPVLRGVDLSKKIILFSY